MIIHGVVYYSVLKRKERRRTSLVVWWLGLRASTTAENTGCISGWGSKISPHCSMAKKKKKKEGDSHLCYHEGKNLEDILLSEINQFQKDTV